MCGEDNNLEVNLTVFHPPPSQPENGFLVGLIYCLESDMGDIGDRRLFCRACKPRRQYSSVQSEQCEMCPFYLKMQPKQLQKTTLLSPSAENVRCNGGLIERVC